MTTVDIIIVHCPCQDGFTAELCARYYYKTMKPDTQYEVWGMEPNKDTCQQEIMRRIEGFIKSGNTCGSVRCFDLSIQPIHANTLQNGLGTADIQVYDHHVTFDTAWKEYERTSPTYFAKWAAKIHYDVTHCGAYLAWKYYFPDLPVPRYILYVEDRDLWRHTQPDSKEINEALYVTGRTLSTPDDWFAKFFGLIPEAEDALFAGLVESGKYLLIAKNHRIECLYKTGFRINFDGYVAFSCNATHIDASDLGNYAVHKDYQIALLWRFDGKTKRVNVSVRSNNEDPNGGVDVSKLCVKYGGGGHKNAAGFELDPAHIGVLLHGNVLP